MDEWSQAQIVESTSERIPDVNQACTKMVWLPPPPYGKNAT